MSVASLGSHRRWHLMLALSCSSSSTLIAVIMSGVTSSLWQPWASQISRFLGCQTCSCWWLAWWVDLLPEPSPWNPHMVRLFYKTYQTKVCDLKWVIVWVCWAMESYNLSNLVHSWHTWTDLAELGICLKYYISFLLKKDHTWAFFYTLADRSKCWYLWVAVYSRDTHC